MFWAPNFFKGSAPEFLDLHYKIHPSRDHVAKVRSDRPRELEGTNVPGGLIKTTAPKIYVGSTSHCSPCYAYKS